MTKIIIAILSIFAGVASSTQGLYNGYWKDKIDLKTILLVNSLVVLACVAIFFILTLSNGDKFSIDKMSPSILVGGICGFLVIMIFAIAFPAIGATTTSLLFIVGLLGASLFYDHIAALNLTQQSLSLEKTVGIILVIVGTFLTLRSSA